MHLERVNVVDFIISIDEDCIIIGAKKMHYDVNFNNSTFKLHGRNSDILRKDVNPLLQYDPCNCPLIASLLGSYYTRRIKNIGFATLFNNLFPKLVTWKENEAMLVINNNLKQKMNE